MSDKKRELEAEIVITSGSGILYGCENRKAYKVCEIFCVHLLCNVIRCMYASIS